MIGIFSDEENAIDLFSYIENKIENFGSNNSKNTFELKPLFNQDGLKTIFRCFL